jgi:hypothetical protein
MFDAGTNPLELDLNLTHLQFVKKWRFYIRMASTDRINELNILCQGHLDDPKIQEIIPLIEQRLKQQ